MRLNHREHPRFLQTTQGSCLSQDQGSKGRTGSLQRRWENGEGIVQVEKKSWRPAMLFTSQSRPSKKEGLEKGGKMEKGTAVKEMIYSHDINTMEMGVILR